MLCDDNHLPCIVCASVSERATEPGHTLYWDQTRYCARTSFDNIKGITETTRPCQTMQCVHCARVVQAILSLHSYWWLVLHKKKHGMDVEAAFLSGMLQTEVGQRGQQISDLLSARMSPNPSKRMPKKWHCKSNQHHWVLQPDKGRNQVERFYYSHCVGNTTEITWSGQHSHHSILPSCMRPQTCHNLDELLPESQLLTCVHAVLHAYVHWVDLLSYMHWLSSSSKLTIDGASHYSVSLSSWSVLLLHRSM